ncbi:hypothetical protein SB581_07330 [Acinetobacter baumannii]|nr:hypothetical protein SB581_07330 [Acinetobacter baumannii]
MKVFILIVTESDYEWSNSEVSGVFYESEFERFLQLIKDKLPQHQKLIFNDTHFQFEKLERDFREVTNALNCKDKKSWELNFYQYFKSDEAKSKFSNTDSFEIECHWLANANFSGVSLDVQNRVDAALARASQACIGTAMFHKQFNDVISILRGVDKPKDDGV